MKKKGTRKKRKGKERGGKKKNTRGEKAIIGGECLEYGMYTNS